MNDTGVTVMEEKSRFFPDAFNWWELADQPCERCSLPMHMASGQDVAFCPNCAIDNKNAFNGRTLLAVAKAKALRGNIDAAEKERIGKEDDEDKYGVFKFGMPL